MINSEKNLACSCECGESRFSIRTMPLLRVICHCQICQEFNNAPYADVTIFRFNDVEAKENNNVIYKRYRSPPAIPRGKCAVCNQPVIELLDLPLFPALTIIPSANIPNSEFFIEPSLHVFYHRRVADAGDNLPKYSGYWKSQLGLSKSLIPALLRNR